MITEWLHKKEKKELIVFYNGWGMDARPFQDLASKRYDVVCCSNYIDDSNIPDISSLAHTYDKIVLVGWSMGVFFAQHHFSDKRDLFYKAVAVNGTLCPVHDTQGIPVEVVYSTLRQLSDATLLKFYKRMCKSLKTYNKFLQHKPLKEVGDVQLELQHICDVSDCIDEKDSMFSHVIITDKDYIMPSANQLVYWKNSKVYLLKGAHFPFYQLENWDNLILLTH